MASRQGGGVRGARVVAWVRGVLAWGGMVLAGTASAQTLVPLTGAQQVAAGTFFSCALMAGGEARCWGRNLHGQLGDNSTTTRLTSVTVSGLNGATAIATGGAHACAVVAGGEVRCWGFNSGGQLGDGTITSRQTPVPVSGLTGATAIAAGGTHACAVVAGGEVRCWGLNTSGQLGDNSATNRLTPVAVSGLTGATGVSAGGDHTCALVAGGEVRCWGLNTSGQLGDNSTTNRLAPVAVSGLSGAIALVAGRNHTCAVLAGGEVRCWGNNNFGQLGDSSTTNRLAPVAVSGLSGATAIAAGGLHTCALLAMREVRCWGNNSGGQLGDNSTTDRSTPVAVTGLTGATGIATGESQTCAVVRGEVRCWGSRSGGQLGDNASANSSTPLAVSGLSGATAIAAGAGHTCAVVAGGEVSCWGANNAGQIGDNSTTNRLTPVAVSGLRDATAIATGNGYSCTVVAGGEVRCWGSNSGGQLGDNSTTTRLTPVAVSSLAGATAIAAGGAHACALVAGGEVRCWGSNVNGQLGDNSTTSRLTPVAVTGLTGATTIAAGNSHTCALLAGGAVRCWGSNVNGQLGDNSTTSRLTPVAVNGLSGATAIAAGNSHTCALLAGGAVRCWGSNGQGQLGDNSTTQRLTPVEVSGLSGATAIASKALTTCALVAGGEGRCWGFNSGGQLGDDGTTNRRTPVAVSRLSGATAIATGFNHTCALVAGGEGRCWGINTSGELGDGIPSFRPIPAPVLTVVDGLAFQGRSLFEPSLSGGRAILQVGSQSVTGTIDAEGRFNLALPLALFTSSNMASLRVEGVGERSHVVGVSLLGPADRLVTEAGADLRLTYDENAFVHVSARTTALSAAMRAHNGFADIATAVDFDRASLAYQLYAGDLAHAVELVSRGLLTLPAGQSTTWSALETLSGSQQLYAAYNALVFPNCTAEPNAPICAAIRDVNENPEISPVVQPSIGVLYGQTRAHSSIAFALPAWRWTSATQGEVFGYGDTSRAVAIAALPNGGWRLVPLDGQPLSSSEQFVFRGNAQVRSVIQTSALLVRLTRGAGGRMSVVSTIEQVRTFPNNPEIPNEPILPFTVGFGLQDISNVVPASLLGNAPSTSNVRLVLPTPFPSTDPGTSAFALSFGYDVHSIGSGSGTTERGGLSFTVQRPSPDRIELRYSDGSTSAIRLLSEDVPGVWRVTALMRNASGSRNTTVEGRLLEVASNVPQFTATNILGSWASEINGALCLGPYRGIDRTAGNAFCFPSFGFRFEANGTVSQLSGGVPRAWEIIDAPRDRLSFLRGSSAQFQQRRGWEILREESTGRRWILENWASSEFSANPPAVGFVPTSRLSVLIPLVATVPGAPTIGTATAGDGRATVTFTAPASNGDAPITGYTVTSSPGGITASGSASPITVTGLTNGTGYTFTVTATNAVGAGPASAASNVVTPRAPQAAQTITFGTAPTVVVGGTGTVSATASSGLPVSLSSQTAAVCTVSGSTVTGVSAGTCTIAANQAGNASFLAAPEVTQSFAVVALPPLEAEDDRVLLSENSAGVDIAVLGNDRFEAARLAGGSLTIVRQPGNGSASVLTGADAASVADDQIRFVPARNWSGSDSLRYRLCEGGTQPRCAEAAVFVEVRPISGGLLELQVSTNRGFREVPLSGLRALPGVQFAATSLSAPVVGDLPLSVDSTPETPWDNGRAGTAHVSGSLAGRSGSALSWHVFAEAAGSGDVDLYLGEDLNGDGQPSENELRCTSAMSAAGERCELALTVAAGGTGRYWAMVHNRGSSAQTGRLSRYEVPLLASDGSLVTTAPGILAAGESFPLRVQWDDPTLLGGESRVGYVQMILGGATQAVFPVKLTRTAEQSTPLALESGVDRTLRIAGNGSHEQLFIDVPAGATRLLVTTTSGSNVDVYLARVAPPSAGSTVPAIGTAPPRNQAQASGTTPGGNESVEVLNPAAGRWYVTPVNMTASAATVVVRATVSGTAPTVRAGGYFNTGRSGHGLFIYPAGGVWAGIWYTYREDRTPTWYYLQGDAPGANGIWQGEIYRATLVGGSRFLTVVGQGTATPTGPDAFTFSYTLDGQMGSEPFSGFGRGCPNLGGRVVDASGHWFDPTRTGTGYSVQLLPNYEFYALFLYTARGEPIFLTAERPGVGQANDTVPVQQLRGFCPLCARGGDPERSTVGVLRREFVDGRLSRMNVDVRFTDGVTGTWVTDDAVIPLGGLQGCQAN